MKEKKYSFRRLSLDSQEYQDEIRDSLEFAHDPDESTSFGDGILAAQEYFDGNIPENQLKLITGSACFKMKVLMRLHRETGAGSKYIRDMISAAMEREDLSTRSHAIQENSTLMEEIGYDADAKEMDPADFILLLISFKPGNMDQKERQLVADVLAHHAKFFKERYKNFYEQEVPRLKNAFIKKVRAKKPPLPISSDVLERKVEQVAVHVVDGPAQVFHPGSHNIRLNPKGYGESVDEHTFDHEMMHAISASGYLQIHIDKGIDPFDEDIQKAKEKAGHDRIGTMFKSGRKFDWLNEGLTELMTSEIRDCDPREYPESIRLLKLLFEQDEKLKKLMYEAYFEDVSTDDSPDMRIPRWKRLIRHINDYFGKRFLQNLDAYINQSIPERYKDQQLSWRDGLKACIRDLEKHSDNIYAFIEDSLKSKKDAQKNS